MNELGTPSGKPSGVVKIIDCGEISQDKKNNVMESDEGKKKTYLKMASSSDGLVKELGDGKKKRMRYLSSEELVQATNCGDVSEDKVMEHYKPPSSSVRKEEPEAKLQKDNDSKKSGSLNKKLEATLKNNLLNPHQHSYDPSSSRYLVELACRMQLLEDLAQWQTQAILDIARATKIELGPISLPRQDVDQVEVPADEA